MMGVPKDRVDFVFDKSNMILGAGDVEYTPEGTDIIGAIMGAAFELAALMKEMLEERSKTPTDDLTSALLYAEVEGEKLSEEEIASFFILLLVAGNETTRNALSWGLHLLTENPEQKEILWNDFENLAPKAVEEIVRWASPVIFMRRTATRDGVRIGDQEFEEGDKLSLYYWAANRDPSVFENPHEFNISRQSNDHFGYGAPGPHFCLGAHLARREITVMLREIRKSIPGLVATEQPDRLMSGFINGIKHLHCTW
jgi:cytochrome P450